MATFYHPNGTTVYDPSSMQAAYGRAGGNQPQQPQQPQQQYQQDQQDQQQSAGKKQKVAPPPKIGFGAGTSSGYIRSTTPINSISLNGGASTASPNAATPQQTAAMTAIGQKTGADYNAAKAANDARYNQLLQLADQFGATQNRQTNQLYDQQQANNLQNLIGSGLGNSTVLTSNATGIQNARTNALADVNERVSQNKSGIIERRTDEYPNLSMFASLLQQPGAMGNGTLDLLKSFLGK